MAFDLHVLQFGLPLSWAHPDACSEDHAKIYAYWISFADIMSPSNKSELNRVLNQYLGELFSLRVVVLPRPFQHLDAFAQVEIESNV